MIEVDLIERAMRRYLTSARIILESVPDSLLVLIPEDLRKPLRPVLRQKINEVLGCLQRIPEKWETEPETVWENLPETAKY